MTRIKVDPDLLRVLADELRTGSEQVHDTERQVHRLARSLSWQIRDQARFEDDCDFAGRTAGDLAERLMMLARSLSDCADRFAAADAAGLNSKGRELPYERVSRMIGPLVPPWMIGGFPTSEIVGLGLLGTSGGPPLPYTRLSLMDKLLRQESSLDPMAAIPQAQALADLAAIIGLKRNRYGSPETEGWTPGYFEVKGPSLTGMSVELDALHYEKKISGIADLSLNVGHGSFEVETIKIDRSGIHGELKVAAEAALLDGEVDIAVGNDDVSLALGGEGEVLGANGELSIGEKGIKAQAMAYGAHGKAGVSFNVFDWSFTLGVQGCAACAGASVEIGWEGELEAGALLGGGIFWEIEPR